MDVKNFVLSYYKNSDKDFYVHKVENSLEALKPHTHEYFQIYYIAKGSLIHYIGSDSSLLSKGDMFIIPPGKPHHIAPTADAVFYVVSFMPEFLEKENQATYMAINFLRNLQSEGDQDIHPKVSVSSENIFFVENILEHVLLEFKEKRAGHREMIHTYTLLLVTMLARNYVDIENQLPNCFENYRQLVMHCIEYVEHHFMEDLSLEEICKRSAVSKGIFCRVFKELTGHSFNRYLNICRIKKATEYIEQRYKITAIYGLCGYADFSTFHRNFKSIIGISPKEYKKQGE